MDSSGIIDTSVGEPRPQVQTEVTSVQPVGIVRTLSTLVPSGVRKAPLARIDVPVPSTETEMPLVPFAFLNSGGIARNSGTPL